MRTIVTKVTTTTTTTSTKGDSRPEYHEVRRRGLMTSHGYAELIHLTNGRFSLYVPGNRSAGFRNSPRHRCEPYVRSIMTIGAFE
jgi:hypothetical protein